MPQTPANQPPDDGLDDEIETDAETPGWMPPKQPVWAFALSFFLPGAGLLYLGKPLAGLANFIIVVELGAAIYMALPTDVFERCAPWIGIVFQVGSGLFAQSLANAQWIAFQEKRRAELDE
jgi:TM2 domain-containing membrane protein YozV